MISENAHTATSDYIPLERVLTFTSNDDLCENVTTTEDDILETVEIFQIALTSSDPNVSAGAFPSANITILDNDGKIKKKGFKFVQILIFPMYTVVTVTLEIGEDEVEEGVAVVVCVSFSNEIGRDVVVELTTSSGIFPNPASGNYALIARQVVHCFI